MVVSKCHFALMFVILFLLLHFQPHSCFCWVLSFLSGLLKSPSPDFPLTYPLIIFSKATHLTTSFTCFETLSASLCLKNQVHTSQLSSKQYQTIFSSLNMPCYFKTLALHKGRFAMMTRGLCDSSDSFAHVLPKPGMIFRIQGGRSSLARGLNQRILLSRGVVVLGMQAEPLCCGPSFSLCPELNDSFSVATSSSIWALSWTPQQKS